MAADGDGDGELVRRVRSPSSRGRMAPTLAFLLVLLLLLAGGGGGGAFLAAAASTDTVVPGKGMAGNQTLVSKNGRFELGLGLDAATGTNVSLTFKGFSHNGSLQVDASRRNGFVLTTDGIDSRGAFPDWMVTSQDNGSSLVLNHPDAPNSTEFLQFNLGLISLMRWSDSTAGWVARWTFPSDCKSGAFFCGDFGACTAGGGGGCECVDGFTPSYPDEWRLGYFVTGCSRSLPLSCEANGQTEHDDSFAILDNLRGLPYNAQDEPVTTDEDCRAACLNKCYCVAYSNESGCKLWYHNLYNLSSADKPPYSKIYVRLGSKLKSNRGLATRWIVLLVVGSLAVTSVMLGLVLLCRYRRDLFASSKFEVEGSLIVYTYAQIRKATGNFSDKLDSRLEGNANVKELDITCRVACWCIQDEENDRPSMGQVVRMLEGVVDMEMPPIPASFQNLMESEDSGIYSEESWNFRTRDQF
ncbi:hypothetical protein OsI_00959 [Oryza sativa Indica Group]|uniref:Apple domain-containing protein n=1 Tax=Oryza sativa subsp. indica TaxID=39946 RepID=B8AB24_ORYSI|nr:hypothetical protein OsI_00959 [Oryza sativa Indica Group]